MAHIRPDPELPRIAYEVIPFEGEGPKARELSVENLDEEEKLLHEVDRKHCGAAIWSKDMRTAEKYREWAKKYREEKKEANKKVNEKSVRYRARVCAVRENFQAVEEYNKQMNELAQQHLIQLKNQPPESRGFASEVRAATEEICAKVERLRRTRT